MLYAFCYWYRTDTSSLKKSGCQGLALAPASNITVSIQPLATGLAGFTSLG